MTEYHLCSPSVLCCKYMKREVPHHQQLLLRHQEGLRSSVYLLPCASSDPFSSFLHLTLAAWLHKLHPQSSFSLVNLSSGMQENVFQDTYTTCNPIPPSHALRARSPQGSQAVCASYWTAEGRLAGHGWVQVGCWSSASAGKEHTNPWEQLQRTGSV